MTGMANGARGRTRRAVIAAMAVLLAAGVLIATARGDDIRLKNGTKYTGKLVSEEHDKIVFRADFGGATVDLEFKPDDVKYVTVNGRRRAVKPKLKPKPQPKPAKTEGGKSSSEVDELIAKVGPTKPEWFDSIPLHYPSTLNLTWRMSARGWKPHVNLRQYITSIINPAPKRWKEGIRLIHHTLGVNRADRGRLRISQGVLAAMYFNYLADYARAAYWWQQAGGRNHVKLAACYLRLGCKPLAAKMVSAIRDDNTPDGSVIRLWSKMGEIDKALWYAEKAARAGRPDVAYLAAGDACRREGRYETAQGFYQKVIDAKRGSRDIKRNTARATGNLEAVKLLVDLKMAGMPDGDYSAEADAYAGPVKVGVNVEKGRITSIEVLEHRDKQAFRAPVLMPERIIANQDPKPVKATSSSSSSRRRRRPPVPEPEPEMKPFLEIDTVSGATCTSEAIFNATFKALAAARKKDPSK